MSDVFIKLFQNWATILVAVIAIVTFIKLAGANEARVSDHERRIQMLEAKFEKALENQANMAGDIRVIRAIIEKASK